MTDMNYMFTRAALPIDLRTIIVNPSMRHFPTNPHTNDTQWHWCKDEFVPPLSQREFRQYCAHPASFRRDLLANLRMYRRFCIELLTQTRTIRMLPQEKQLIASLTLLFLFQSAMDYHYYRYDYLLDLEEYPKSPVGWHYLRMKTLVVKAASSRGKLSDEAWVNEQLLMLLGKKASATIRELTKILKGEQVKTLNSSYQAIQIFLRVQQEEEKLFYGKNQKGPIFTAGYAIWRSLQEVATQSNILGKKQKQLLTILNGDPIYGTRYILVHMNKLFPGSIVQRVRDNLKQWY